MINKKKGQISTEYLIIVGFIVFLIISTLTISIYYSNQTKDRIKFNQLQNFANKIISSSEIVFYSGEPSKTTIIAYLPAGIEGLEITDYAIVFNVSSSTGLTRISFSSNVPIEGLIGNSEGVKEISIIAKSDKIVLSES